MGIFGPWRIRTQRGACVVALALILACTPLSLLALQTPASGTSGTAGATARTTSTATDDSVFLLAGKDLVAQSTLDITSTSGTALTALTLVTSGGSGTGTVSFSVVSGTATGCSVVGDSLSAASAGTCVVTATKAADATYSAISSAATTVTFALATQSALRITSTTGTFGTPLLLTITGGSGDGVPSLSVVDGTATGCSLMVGTLTTTSAGTCLVTVTKASDGTYGAASSAATTVTFASGGKPSIVLVKSFSVTFGASSSALSNATKDALIDLSRKLSSVDSVHLIGYAWKNTVLATSRAKAVEKYLLNLKKIRVTIQIVINVPIMKVKVVTT